MNYTKNYHLPQWVKSDRIMMDDFNRMCQDMENGLLTVKAEAESGIQAAKSKAESDDNAVRNLAVKAQNTANTAVSKADAAQATANAAYCPGKFPYTIGTYTGTGEQGVERPITLGFKPRFVLVTARVSGAINIHVMGGEGITELHPINLTEDGFTVLEYSGWPKINVKDVPYSYLAFR